MLFSNKYNTKYFGYINSFCKIIVTKQYNAAQWWVCHKNNWVKYITKNTI